MNERRNGHPTPPLGLGECFYTPAQVLAAQAVRVASDATVINLDDSDTDATLVLASTYPWNPPVDTGMDWS